MSERVTLTADELAAHVRTRRVGHHRIERVIRELSGNLATELRSAFPELTDGQIGGILLHAGMCIAGLIERLEAGHVAPQNIYASAANVVALAGEQLHSAQPAAGGRPQPITEYAQRMSNGDWTIFYGDEEFPLEKRIEWANRYGVGTAQRTVVVLEDWRELPRPDLQDPGDDETRALP